METIKILASNMKFENLTIQNLVTVERAVAVNITNSADKIIFKDCNIYGHQDTYYFWNCYRVYHVNCKITGSVDYIFGTGTALFDNCQLVINRNGGVLTAASTTSNLTYGLVFRGCTITSDATGFDSAPITSFYLGRPWQNNPKTVFLYCDEPSTLNAAGWTLMDANQAASVNQNTLFAEYQSTGTGSGYGSRATVSGNANYGRQLTSGEALNYTVTNIFAAASKTDTPFPNGDWYPADAPADAMPVELTSFTAVANGRNIELQWHTATEKNSFGFDIEKSVNGSWNKIGFIEGKGNSNSPSSYSFVDINRSVSTISYRLKQIDRDGKFTYSNTIEVIIALTAKDYALTQNYPNPFNPSTTFSFAMKKAELTSVKVYNLVGQEVAKLFNQIAEPDQIYTMKFDGKDLSSGIYFYSLRSASRNEMKKMILMK